jgi:glycosyltransferase involved in cell wall biosynthesis
VVLLTGWQTFPFIQLLSSARAAGIPVLMRGESHALKPRGAMAHRFHRWLFHQVDAFLVIGRANRALYERHHVSGDRLFDAPYFVDNERFATEAASWRTRRGELRSSLGMPEHATCFIFAGKFEPKKHPQDVIAALGAVHRRRPDLPLHALFVGDGILAGALQARAAAEGIAVTFAGFVNQSEIPRFYVAADALVLPSDYDETWGLVVNEAMACGLPALVSDRAGSGPDLVGDGRTGARYPFGDIDALAALVERWAANPDSMRALGRAAESRVRTEYTIDLSVDAIRRAARSVTEDRRRLGARP